VAVESLHDPRAAQPHTLAYDDLPPGSDLRRQYGEDGSVIITSPAGEPSEAACREALQRTGILAAIFAGAPLTGGAIAFATGNGPRVATAGLNVLAAILFAVFSAGVFLLVWRVAYTDQVRWLTQARRNVSLLHASRRRLLVETTGPSGDESLDLPAHAISSLRIEQAGYLRVRTLDGRTYRLLPGHHQGELRWVTATLRQTLGWDSVPSDKEWPQSR